MSKNNIIINNPERISEVRDILVASINDWPNPIDSLEQFEREIASFLDKRTFKRNLEYKLESIDLSEYAWHAESLSQVLELFDFYQDEVTLKEIFDSLSDVLRFDK